MSDMPKIAGRAVGKAAGRTVNVIGKLARGAGQAAGRTARIARLDLRLAEERRNAESLYAELGRLYYEAHQGDPEGFFVQLFQQLDASTEAISSLQAELAALRREADAPSAAEADRTEPDIEIEIEVQGAEDPEPKEE